MDSQCDSLVQSIGTANHDRGLVPRLEDACKFQYLLQILQVQFQDYVPKYQIFVDREEIVDALCKHWQEPTTLWDGQPVLGFMAETFLDDLPTVGFKDFNPMWSFPTTSVHQWQEPMTFGMAPWHLTEDVDKQKSKEALQSQSPIAAFKACNVIQAIGVAYSKVVLPSSDTKGESKNRTYCPTTWRNSYTWQYSSQYADQLRTSSRASSLLCKECTLLVRIQLSNKNQNHADCAFADTASTVMCGAMISLTPCNQPNVERGCDLEEYAEFQSADDMIQKLNEILAITPGFPQIPAPRKDCHKLTFPANKRHKQYVMCPEQDCEALVYMSDQNTSMIEALGLHEDPFWKERVEYFYSWFRKSSKIAQQAWTWEEGSASKWSTTSTRGSSKRGQSVPLNPANRPNPAEEGLQWRDIGDLDTRLEYLYPENSSEPCPIAKSTEISSEEQDVYMQWIAKVLKVDRKTSKDPRLHCAYCDMNNHPRFACKHVSKHQKSYEKASMQIVCWSSSSIPMPSSSDQWWSSTAQLVQARVQACKARRT